jgi:hypothetical protein
MPDPFADQFSRLDSPAARHAAITPANSDLATRPRALKCLTAGNVVVRDEAGVDVTYPVAAGELLQIRAVQVRTGTTATVVGWW